MEPLFRAARQRGVHVLLDEIGGDGLLATRFAHLTDLLKQEALAEFTPVPLQVKFEIEGPEKGQTRAGREAC
jgi:hypothetical protein